MAAGDIRSTEDYSVILSDMQDLMSQAIGGVFTSFEDFMRFEAKEAEKAEERRKKMAFRPVIKGYADSVFGDPLGLTLARPGLGRVG